MLKSKFKFMFLLLSIIVLISTFSFATEENPEATPGETTEISVDDLLAAQEGSGQEGSAEANQEQVAQPSGDWINNDLYEFGDKIEINQVVDGNVFIMAKEVVISSEIGGDAFIMANKVTINGGYIYSNLFVIAQEIELNGIAYDVYALANSFTLGSEGYVYRDLKVSANTININGKVRRDAYLASANYNFNEENGTLIGGNLNYESQNELNLAEDTVLGEVKYHQEVVKEESIVSKVLNYIFKLINNLLFTFVVILLSIWLAPKFVERATNMSINKAFTSLGIGILAPIVIVIALFLLLVSMVATNIALATTFVFIAICMSGTAFASIYFGGLFAKLVKWEGKVKFVLASLIAALIIWLISLIPVIGGLFGFLVSLFGIGTLFVNAIFKKEKVAKKETPEVQE